MSAFEWVVQCLRAFLDLPHHLGDDGGRASEPDWDEVRTIIGDHFVHGYVLKGLSAAGAWHTVPSDMRETLESGMAGIADQNLRLCRALHSVHRVLSDAGIDLLALKGPVLALRTVGDVTTRPSADIDVLVRTEQLKSAIAALTTAGYRPADARRGLVTARLVRKDSEIEMLDPENNLIEIHWKFLPPAWRLGIAPTRIWTAARMTDFFGLPVLAPGETHEIVYLAVHHGAKHQWGGLTHVIDFHLLATRCVADWPSVWRDARNTGAHTALETAFRVCQRVLGTDVQYAGLAWSKDEPVASMLAEQFAAGLRREQVPDGLQRMIQYFRLRERLRERIVYAPQLARWIFVPTDKEDALLGPRLAKVIGVPVRLIRLALKYSVLRVASRNHRRLRRTTND